MAGNAHIIGVAETCPSSRPEQRAAIDLLVDTGRRAILDAGLGPKEVDGLLVAPLIVGAPLTAPAMVAGILGLRPSYLDIVDLGGATAAGMVWRAAAAISVGACTAVLCVLGETTDTKSFYASGVRWEGMPAAEYERPYGPMGPTTGYALVAQRHSYEFGTTDAQRAQVAVFQRTNAMAHPGALHGSRALTVEDVLASPLVADPLHLLEIVQPCAGACAFVVARFDVPPSHGLRRVELLGFGERTTHSLLSDMPSLTDSAIAESAGRAFESAGIRPRDVDLLSIYDCYTITVLITLEDAGFCAKGKSGRFVDEHDLTWRGDIPVNTHGGQLSYGQAGLAGGATHIVEAVLQLRGTAAGRQVERANIAFVHGNGGVLGEQCSLVIGGA